jgi:hypothetical protein
MSEGRFISISFLIVPEKWVWLFHPDETVWNFELRKRPQTQTSHRNTIDLIADKAKNNLDKNDIEISCNKEELLSVIQRNYFY